MYLCALLCALCLYCVFMQPDNWRHWMNVGTFSLNAFTMSMLRRMAK